MLSNIEGLCVVVFLFFLFKKNKDIESWILTVALIEKTVFRAKIMMHLEQLST